MAMLKDSFNLHLVSNASSTTFPYNNPSKFSTILADEITLDNASWEVGVRQIMYPTTIANTSEDDKISIYKYEEYYRDLLPHPARQSDNLDQVGAMIDVGVLTPVPKEQTVTQDVDATAASSEMNFAKNKATDNNEAMIRHILKTVSESKWTKKRILQLEYKDSSKKFVLHLYKDDIVLTFSSTLQVYLGFKNTAYTKGSHWAWSQFQGKMESTLDMKDMKIYLFDLQVLESESHLLLPTYDTVKYDLSYEKTIENQFKDTVPDEMYYAPNFTFRVSPSKGKIERKSIRAVEDKFKMHEKRLMFIRFDSNSTKHLKLRNIYAVSDKIDYDIAIPTLSTKRKLDDSVEAKTIAQLVTSVRATFYYISVRMISHDLELKPFDTFSLSNTEQLKKPIRLLPSLNVKMREHKYIFSFNKKSQRFTVYVPHDRALELSKTLKSVLGFDGYSGPNVDPEGKFRPNTHTIAPHSPLIDRAITGLYVYCNIIDAVYIGDVKAPLLLSCAFKKNAERDIVYQKEFLNPSYVPLNRKTIRQIDIDVYDDAGARIPFLYGRTNLSLHFRRRE